MESQWVSDQADFHCFHKHLHRFPEGMRMAEQWLSSGFGMDSQRFSYNFPVNLDRNLKEFGWDRNGLVTRMIFIVFTSIYLGFRRVYAWLSSGFRVVSGWIPSDFLTTFLSFWIEF